MTALELPSIAIVAQSGSPQRAIRAGPEIRRTSQRYFFLVLALSGSWHVTNVTRTRLGPGDIIFYDSRYPLDCDLLLHWKCRASRGPVDDCGHPQGRRDSAEP